MDYHLKKLNNPLIQSIVEDMSGENEKSNNEEDDGIYLEEEKKEVIGGNDSSNNNIDNQLENKNKYDKLRGKMKNRNMANKIRNEKNSNIDIKNYGTINAQMKMVIYKVKEKKH